VRGTQWWSKSFLSTAVRTWQSAGQAVRRKGRAWSPAALTLLQHFEREGIAGRRVHWALTTAGGRF